MNQLMNNPILQLMGLLQSGRSPSAIVQTMAQSNPQARQIVQMLNGKTPQQLEQMARNMAKERGTTIEDIARSMGIQIPSNR